jgi:two-component system, OmpR family, response regulator
MTRAALRVLYVDDDRINTLLFVQVCKPDTRLEVLTAANAEDALEIAREARPGVFVVDLHMPDGDGLQLLRRLRELDGLAQTPAFLCTAERLEEVQDSARKAGFAGVWIKPVQLPMLQHDLSRVVGL